MKIDPSKVKALLQTNKKNQTKSFMKKGKKGAPPEGEHEDDEDEDEEDEGDKGGQGKKPGKGKPPKDKPAEHGEDGHEHEEGDEGDEGGHDEPDGDEGDEGGHDEPDGDEVTPEQIDEMAEEIAAGKGDKKLMKWASKVNEQNNPPKVIDPNDEHIWDAAKEAASKYEDDENFYKIVMSIFEKMGGKFRAQK